MTFSREEYLATHLRENGYKLTKPRRAVIHALAATLKPLSINDLHEAAQTFDSSVGLVTIYRTLELLESLALVRPVHLMDNCHGYILASPGHTHHLVCHRCHHVVEIEGCDLNIYLQQIESRTGFAITGHWLELEGLCPACREHPPEQ